MILRLCVLAMMAFAVAGCGSGDAPTDVEEIQKEAQAQVPKDLGEIPPEIAQEGARTMGGGKQGGGGVAPP